MIHRELNHHLRKLLTITVIFLSLSSRGISFKIHWKQVYGYLTG